jgi:hypothetical protein
MLVVLGCFHAIDGLVALFRNKYYVVRPSGLVVQVNYTAWGWAHIVLGIVALATGAGLLRGNAVARPAAVVVAVVSAIVNLTFISAEPAWSLIVIVLDVADRSSSAARRPPPRQPARLRRAPAASPGTAGRPVHRERPAALPRSWLGLGGRLPLGCAERRPRRGRTDPRCDGVAVVS